MSIVVETGSGSATAESWITVAEFKTYCDAHGLSYGSASDALIEQALRRAVTWMEAKYSARYAGTWAVDGQALSWPRLYAYFRLTPISSTTIPTQVKAAQAEAAVRELASPGSLNPDVTPGKVKKRVRVEGAVEVEYAVGSGGVASQQPVVSIIDGILAPLIGAASSPYVGRAVRA